MWQLFSRRSRDGGQLNEAVQLFERTLGYANDLGLLAEEINPKTSEHLGNFPQGFSHMALIGAAVNLTKAARHGPEEVTETESEHADRLRALYDCMREQPAGDFAIEEPLSRYGADTVSLTFEPASSIKMYGQWDGAWLGRRPRLACFLGASLVPI